MNIIMDGPSIRDADNLRKLISGLDDDLDIFNLPSQQYFLEILSAHNASELIKK